MGEFAIHSSRPTNRRSPRRWILSHLTRQWWLFIIVLVGAFGNAALAAAMPVLIGVAFDAALATPPQMETIGWAALGILVSQVVRSVLQLGRNFASSVMGERLELGAAPAERNYDRLHRKAMAQLTPEERLAQAISWNRVAGEFLEAGRRAKEAE